MMMRRRRRNVILIKVIDDDDDDEDSLHLFYEIAIMTSIQLMQKKKKEHKWETSYKRRTDNSPPTYLTRLSSSKKAHKWIKQNGHPEWVAWWDGGGEGRVRNVNWPVEDTSLVTRLHRNVDQSFQENYVDQSWPLIPRKIRENLLNTPKNSYSYSHVSTAMLTNVDQSWPIMMPRKI